MERILEELARHTDDATRPDVDLYLASGPVLRGRVMKVQQGLATMHLGPAKDASVAYVRVEQIVAVTVIAGGRSARSLTPSKGIGILPVAKAAPSMHDDILTPVNEMSLAAMQAAMATPTPPEVITPMQEERPSRRTGDDVSAAFSAMRIETGSVPAPDPIAEFVASQYDVITPPDPIVPVSIELPPRGSAPRAAPMHLEAPTFLGEKPAKPKTPLPAAAPVPSPDSTFSMRSKTPKPRAVRTPPPSRVDLMRQANTHAEMMSRVLRHRVEIAIAAPLDDDSRRAIGHALPIASDVLLAILSEPKHRAGLDGIASIELVAGDAEVVLDGARLVIRCSLVDRFTPASLRAAIESAAI